MMGGGGKERRRECALSSQVRPTNSPLNFGMPRGGAAGQSESPKSPNRPSSIGAFAQRPRRAMQRSRMTRRCPLAANPTHPCTSNSRITISAARSGLEKLGAEIGSKKRLAVRTDGNLPMVHRSSSDQPQLHLWGRRVVLRIRPFPTNCLLTQDAGGSARRSSESLALRGCRCGVLKGSRGHEHPVLERPYSARLCGARRLAAATAAAAAAAAAAAGRRAARAVPKNTRGWASRCALQAPHRLAWRRHGAPALDPVGACCTCIASPRLPCLFGSRAKARCRLTTFRHASPSAKQRVHSRRPRKRPSVQQESQADGNQSQRRKAAPPTMRVQTELELRGPARHEVPCWPVERTDR
ncbi:hypothetical protein L1887_57808 [Cichorium endivia]|nr:hypothetical protein L1887_57808 [Cichorium endivia]